MGKANFTDDFKRDAVAQITERGGVRLMRTGLRIGVCHQLYAASWRHSANAAERWCL
jgi:transposase